MNDLREKLKRKIKYFTNDSYSFEMKKFDLIVLLTIFSSLITIFIFILGRLKSEVIYFSVFLFIFSLLFGICAHFKGEYKLYSLMYIISTNFFTFPLLYFITADIYNGAPLYLAIGIILTFFILDGKRLIVLLVSELIYDSFLIYFSFRYRDELNLYHSLSRMGTGIIFCFMFAAMFILIILYFQTKLNDKERENTINITNHLSAAGIGKSRFLSNMTNEIRTPINAIFGMVEVILKEDLNDEAKEYTETIKSASSELLNIINNILVYSKLDSNRMELIPTKYNFRELINDVIHSVVLEYSELKSDFSAYIDHNIPTYVYGDDIRIKQIFRYLLFSSIHQLPQGKIRFEVCCDKNIDEHTITFKCKVTESGKGLTESELKAVFGAYNEYDSRQRSDFKGMGLEIFICRKILSLMDGSLNIESIPGLGMAINFEFTNYVLDDDPICEIEDSHQKNVLIYLANKRKENNWMPLMENLKVRYSYVSGISQFKTALEDKKYSHIFISDADYPSLKNIIENALCEDYTYVITDNNHAFEDFGKCKIVRRPIYCVPIAEVLNNRWNKEDYLKPKKHEKLYYPDAKVLVVDDNIVNLKVILSNLEKFKIKADMATSGEGCLNILKEKKYDLLLLDQLMPGMSGIETLHALRKSGGINADITAICITAEFGADIRENLISEGFCDYLAKPIKSFYLDRMLRQYLSDELAVINREEVPDNKAIINEPLNTSENDNKNTDPLELNTALGIELVGGSEEVYNTILVTYYQEGLKKLQEIPIQMNDSDLALYSTNVHALKSSSASIGATNLSARFKALEMAGKSGNRDFVSSNTPETLDYFSKMLDKLSAYMSEHGIAYDEDIAEEPLGEEIKLEASVVTELQKNLANVNLKYCEDAIKELSSNNYGKKINNQINEIRKKYEQFDYRSVKSLLEELLQSL